MTEKFVMNDNHIPDGMLHDQSLYEVSLENDILILSFNILLSEKEYGESDFARKYLEYKKCHIKCVLIDERHCEACLLTALDKKYRGRFQYLPLKDFIAAANEAIRRGIEKDLHPLQYLYTYVSPDINTAKIELCADIKYNRADYSMCTLELAVKEMEFIWEEPD